MPTACSVRIAFPADPEVGISMLKHPMLAPCAAGVDGLNHLPGGHEPVIRADVHPAIMTLRFSRVAAESMSRGNWRSSFSYGSELI